MWWILIYSEGVCLWYYKFSFDSPSSTEVILKDIGKIDRSWNTANYKLLNYQKVPVLDTYGAMLDTYIQKEYVYGTVYNLMIPQVTVK